MTDWKADKSCGVFALATALRMPYDPFLTEWTKNGRHESTINGEVPGVLWTEIVHFLWTQNLTHFVWVNPTALGPVEGEFFIPSESWIRNRIKTQDAIIGFTNDNGNGHWAYSRSGEVLWGQHGDCYNVKDRFISDKYIHTVILIGGPE